MWSVVVESPGKATSSEPRWHNAATPQLVQAKSPHVIADVSYRWCAEARGALCVAWDLRETDVHSVLVSLAGVDTCWYTCDDTDSHAKGYVSSDERCAEEVFARQRRGGSERISHDLSQEKSFGRG